MSTPGMFPQTVSLTCPLCGASLQAEVYHLVDVGLEPELKSRLLRGRLNVARCPSCGGEGVIAAPFLYHDPQKQLLLAFIPPESQLNDQEQQRVIGGLTNLILSYLPPEERKAYLLVPRVLLSYQGLLEAILQAEGITPEMMAAQRARLEVLDRLMAALPDEGAFQDLVAEVDSRLDEEFFAVLEAYIEASRQDGEEERVRALEELQGRLFAQSTYGRRLTTQALLGSPIRPPISRQALLEKMLAASSPEEVGRLLVYYRSTVDYAFFQELTDRLESAEREGQTEAAGRLRTLRDTLLELSEQVDREARAALERAADLLRELLRATEPEAFVRERLSEFDDAFFIVLGANLQAAQAAGREEVYRRLQDLGMLVLEVAQERLPPEVRLIRSLLDAEGDEEVQALLEENRPQVNEDLVVLMRDLADDVAREKAETAAQLRALADRVEAWLGQRPGPMN